MAMLPDATWSFDAEPPYSEFAGVWPGYTCTNPPYAEVQPITTAFARDATIKRHGLYSAHITCRSDGHPAGDCSVLLTQVFTPADDKHGDEAWYGWSWRFPNVTPPNCFCISELTTNGNTHPSYGQIMFATSAADRLQLRLRTGKTPSPGSSDFTPIPPNGYDVTEILLGTGGQRPLTKLVWHDFYMHIIHQAHTDGTLEIWHRQENGAWAKLYSNVNGGGALIQRAPHPTMMWNDVYGAPGENGAYPNSPGLTWEGLGMYRASGPTYDYWFDGFRRRQSEAAILEEFPGAAYTDRELRVRALLKEQIQVWRGEKRTWMWIKKTPVWRAFKELGGT